VPEQLLKFLTYVFLGLLYLFFLRVLRAVWMELREPKAAPPAPVPVAAGPSPYVAPEDPDRGRRSKKSAERVRVLEPAQRKGQEFELGDELTMGRGAGCRVSIPEDTFVSQIHARVFRRDGDLWLEDLGSTNGTFLNDKKVSAPVVIRRGDHLKVGKTVLEVTK
jgi:hypothetical protein